MAAGRAMSALAGMPSHPVELSAEAERVVRRISHPRVWQYDYLMLRQIAAGLAREAARLNGKGGLEILDVGCKHSPYRSLFEKRAARYVGMDLETFPGVSVQGDASRLPFPSDRFDLVLCTQAFYLLARPREALREFVRVTRPGGRVVLTTIGIWPHAPRDRHHHWNRRELEEVLAEFGEARVEENGGYLELVPQLASAALAMGVEGYLARRYGRAGRLAALPLKAVYMGMNLSALAFEGLVRGAARAGIGTARSLASMDDHLAINYLAVVTPRK